jgi:hypothetical protein
MPLIKLRGFFPDHEWEIPGNPEITEVFPAKESLISDIKGVPAAL